jgi:hypothetical protein
LLGPGPSAAEAEHATVGRRDADAADLGGLDVVGEHLEHGDLPLDHEQRLNLHRGRLLNPRGGGRGRRDGDGDLLLLGRGGEGGDGEAGVHVLRAAAVDLARGDVRSADLAAAVGDVERTAVVRERGPVGVAHGGQLLKGEGHGAVGRGEGGQLHGRHGDGRGPRAVQEEQRGSRAARREEEEEHGHEARGHGRGGAGARGRVVVRRMLRRRSGHGGRLYLGGSWWGAEDGGAEWEEGGHGATRASPESDGSGLCLREGCWRRKEVSRGRTTFQGSTRPESRNTHIAGFTTPSCAGSIVTAAHIFSHNKFILENLKLINTTNILKRVK